MTITTTLLRKQSFNPTFPVLMQYTARNHVNEDSYVTFGQLVVLFTSETQGVALAGVAPERIGKPEVWIECTDSQMWQPAEITISNV